MVESLKQFPIADGHIESILIGAQDVKIAFQRWDCKKFNLLFRSFACLQDHGGVGKDIGELQVQQLEEGHSLQYDTVLERYAQGERPYLVTFLDAWSSAPLVELVALRVDIIPCGNAADCNAALFTIDQDEYMGNQPCPYQ